MTDEDNSGLKRCLTCSRDYQYYRPKCPNCGSEEWKPTPQVRLSSAPLPEPASPVLAPPRPPSVSAPSLVGQWEYHTVRATDPLEITRERLDDLGADGWELVGVAPYATDPSNSASGTFGAEAVLIFKRPRRP